MVERDEAAARDLAARVAKVRQGIERERYAGGDPVVELPPRLKGVEIAARVLAAERAGAALALDGVRVNPREDLAEMSLEEAIGALRAWRFAAARVHLDDAGERAHDPVRQQRVALFKALTRLVAALVYTPLDEKPRGGGLADLDEVLGGLDRLGDAERLHYRDEADRLLNQRDAAARGDPFLAAAWTLLRAHLALGAGQDEAATLWLLHLAARRREAPPPLAGAGDAYLADLVARARGHLLALIGEQPPPDGGETKPPHPRELFNALAAHLAAAFDRDPARGMEIFTLAEYIAPDLPPGDGGRGGRQRRAGQARGA